MSESSLQNKILANLRKIKNSEWIKPTTTNRAGTQDILGHIEGVYIAIEVKTNESFTKPSRLQMYRITRTIEKGGVSFWTNSWEDTISKLQDFAVKKCFKITI